MLMKPRYWSVRSPSAGYRGRPSRAKLTFADVPWNLHPVDVLHQVAGQLARLDQLGERAPRVERADHDVGALSSVPSASATPTARPSLVITESTGGVEQDLGAVRLRGPGEHLGEAAVAALVERPGAEVPVVLAHRVEEQHQAGALRHRADLGADDARRGDVALEDVALEVVVEEVGGAAGEQPDQVVHDLLARRRRGARPARRGPRGPRATCRRCSAAPCRAAA